MHGQLSCAFPCANKNGNVQSKVVGLLNNHVLSETSHLRQNGLPEDIIEAPQDVAATEDFSIEPASHVTNVGGDQGGGDGGLGGGERFSPQETHKDDNKGRCGFRIV